MPFETLRIIPSVDVEKTLADNAQGISDSNYIRWRDKIPEKRGGCQLYANAQFNGYITDLHAWQGLNSIRYLGIGTTTNLYTYSNNTSKNISPRYATDSIVPNINSTINTNIFQITDATFAPVSTYYKVVVNTQISIGGVILSGAYNIDTITGLTSYEISTPNKATATVVGGETLPQLTTTNGTSLDRKSTRLNSSH